MKNWFVINKKGFTMIELLGVIVILGVLSVIAIVSVSGYKEKAQKEEEESYQHVLKMAAESYMQANKSQLPKEIGEHVTITSEKLAAKRYLKEDKGGVVKVYKKNNREYDYIIVDSDDPESDVCEPTPTDPVIYFTDSSNLPKTFENLDDLQDAKIYIRLNGGVDDKGTAYAIEGYTYSIFASTPNHTALHEVYNSGTLSANGEKDITVQRLVKEYIDVTRLTNLQAKVTVTNTQGCTNNASTSVDVGDDDNPYCTGLTTTAPTTWIKKGSSDIRTVSVGCGDGKGSGCVRPIFSRTWPNDHQQDAKWGYIQVKDNAGNSSMADNDPLLVKKSICDQTPQVGNKCRVLVNVDKTTPTINVLGAYKAEEANNVVNKTGGNVYTKGTLVVNNDTPGASKTINVNEYSNLKGESWMNLTYYPQGVVFEIEISDNLDLDRWTWETNKSYATSTAGSLYSTISTDSSYDKYSRTLSTTAYDSADCGTKMKKILIGFREEGRRKGKLTVYDKAGNKVELTILANIDVTPPPIPKATYKDYNPTDKGWSKTQYASTNINKDYKIDTKAAGGSKTLSASLSGWNRFEYTLVAAYDSSKNKTDTKLESGGLSFKYLEGKNTIKYRSIDNAENASKYSSTDKVWVDYTPPVCKVTRTSDQETSYGWVGNSGSVTVTAKCTGEDNENKCSGCVTATFSKTYTSDVKRNDAGAKGFANGGSVFDGAGNETPCDADKKVYIDKTKPYCVITGEAAKKNDWRQKGRTIERYCEDKKGTTQSGCTESFKQSKTFATSGKTYTTNEYKAVTIKDKAGNSYKCPTRDMLVYVDKQAPSCSKSKSHQHTTTGVTVTYSCSDHGGSGVVSCPGKDTGLKKDKSHTVKDNVGNSMTCKVDITAYKQYRYIKKNVAATCTNTCCGKLKNKWKSGTSCTWCGMSSSTKKQCSNKASYIACKSSGCTISGKYTDSCWCTCNVTTNTCNKCKDPHFGYQKVKCTNVDCCGYACGSQWTDWGAASTGCKSDYRWLYK